MANGSCAGHHFYRYLCWPKGTRDFNWDPTIAISGRSPDYPFLFILGAAALMPHGSEVTLFFVLHESGRDPVFA